jgi:hypothetical protein
VTYCKMKFPKKGVLIDYIIIFDGLKNLKKLKENHKILLFWKI